jgi:hypothetical protein
MGRISVVAPIIIVLGIINGLEWIYIEEFLLFYWTKYPLMVFLISIPFYINSFLIYANLTACAIVDPGGVSKEWVSTAWSTG